MARVEEHLAEPDAAASTATGTEAAEEEDLAENELERPTTAIPSPGSALSLPAPAAAADALAGLFAQVTVRPSGLSGVTIEAPREVARQLSTMMAAMAQLLAKFAEDQPADK